MHGNPQRKIFNDKTLSVPEAGQKYFGLGRAGSYAAANRGDLPTIRVGRRLRVSVVALERMLEEARPHRAHELIERGTSNFEPEPEPRKAPTLEDLGL
jgi:helix-turn-helix protein